MTTTDLATIDDAAPDVYEPLTAAKAKALDKKIRSASDKLTNNVNTLFDLLEEAANGQIHAALGYSSWTAYIKDAVQFMPNDKIERKSLVALMNGKGMSQRAIAGALGVSQKTVDRDLDEQGDTEGTVTGTDGKTYGKSKPKPKAEPEPEYIDADAEVVDEEPSAEPMTAAQIATEFDDEMVNLYQVTAAMADLMAEENWPKSVKRIARKSLNTLGEYVAALNVIIDELMGPGE